MFSPFNSPLNLQGCVYGYYGPDCHAIQYLKQLPEYLLMSVDISHRFHGYRQNDTLFTPEELSLFSSMRHRL